MLAVRAGGDLDADAPEPVAGALDTGAFAVGVARSWARAGRDVLVIDADAHGTGLARRIGAATRTGVPPAQRGLPSLIAARTPLNARSVPAHCWALRAGGSGSVLLLGAPGHPAGARRSAAWLAERADAVAELGGRWAVVVSMPGSRTEPYAALTRAAALQVTLSPASGTAPPGGLRGVLGAFWLRFDPDTLTLVCAGAGDMESPRLAAAGGAAAGLPVVGRLGPVNESALLGGRARRRDRAALDALGVASDHLHGRAELSAGLSLDTASTNGLLWAHRPADSQPEPPRRDVSAPTATGARR
ncbi:hypothetical protein [Candidatus Poriferisodalis sp.]|uniref:hypothetical protein n=1 Tax=Candidatus Poriferisodalis sp. TaxID=3101277 RepID=UPI003B02CAFE